MDTTGELGGCGNFEDESWSMQNVFTAVANSVSVKTFLAITEIQNFNYRHYDFPECGYPTGS
jgi:hypothetical protein